MFSEIHENHPNLLQAIVNGLWVTAFGTTLAAIDPDQVVAWVTAIAGAVYTLTSIGILTYKRISAAIRDDQREWREYQASLGQPYNVTHTEIANPGHATTPDPDAQSGGQVPR